MNATLEEKYQVSVFPCGGKCKVPRKWVGKDVLIAKLCHGRLLTVNNTNLSILVNAFITLKIEYHDK